MPGATTYSKCRSPASAARAGDRTNGRRLSAQSNVKEHDVNRPPVPLVGFDGLLAAGRQPDEEAVLLQGDVEEGAEVRVVVGDQHTDRTRALTHPGTPAKTPGEQRTKVPRLRRPQ